MTSYDDIPIDIHYNKLLDWLLSRRHAAADWHKSLLIVRSRKSKAIAASESIFQTVPELSGFSDAEDSAISYFDSRTILECLKGVAEFGATNLIGQYVNPVTKAWQDVVDAYPKDGVHLAEAAQLILRNVNYEIPALRKQLAKIEQDQQDCVRKQAECQRQAKSYMEKHAAMCAQLGIEPRHDAREQLLNLAGDITQSLDLVLSKAHALRPAVAYYSEFIKFLTQRNDGAKIIVENVPVLSFLFEHGNVTVYEWRHGVAPEVVLQSTIFKSTCGAGHISQASSFDKASSNSNADIDWGAIDFGEEPSAATTQNEPQAVFEMIYSSNPEQAIVLEETPEDMPVKPVNGDVKRVAEGDEALSVLESTSSRTLLLDDLALLESFLLHRMNELRLAAEGNLSYVETVAMDTAPSVVLQTNATTIGNYLRAVKDLTAELTADRLVHFLKIRSSADYLSKLEGDLTKLKSNAEKAEQLSHLLEKRYSELGDLIPALSKQLRQLARKTLTQKDGMEKAISAKYNNRVVNVMGEVCQLVSLTA